MKRTSGEVFSAHRERKARACTGDALHPIPPPSYWLTSADDDQGHQVFKTRYMRRKLEYLLRTCATHPDGCLERGAMREARVIEVERVENHKVWKQYARTLAQKGLRTKSWKKTEQSRPINCERGDEESFLFHGTNPENLDAIMSNGFDRNECSEGNRYGQGIYFTDESCKAHQYAGYREEEDGSQTFCMLYCRVLPKRTLEYKTTKADREYNFLQGMQQPSPSDPVFRRALVRRGATAKAGQDFDSVVVEADRRGVARGGDPAQVHREIVVFDTEQVYPEFVVWYRTDTIEQEEERRQEHELLIQMEMFLQMRKLQQAQHFELLKEMFRAQQDDDDELMRMILPWRTQRDQRDELMQMILLRCAKDIAAGNRSRALLLALVMVMASD